MIGPERRRTIFLLYEEGMGVREISRRLHVSRNAVRAIVAEKGQTPTTVRRDKLEVDPELLRRLYSDCDGYIQRIHEKLTEEEGVEVGYSTLTRRVRELGLGAERDERCGRVDDVPGAEMQHDTSPYTVRLGDRPVKVVGSLLYLRYCKRKYLKFSRRFDRFRMKCFLHEALLSWGHAAATCVIDNTNLARLRGTGSHAVIVPEMETFAQQYGFRFLCHEKGHCDRKAGEERSFRTLETSFFPGRRFTDLQDMNRQALDWSTVRMDNRPVKGSGLIPAKAFEHERAFLVVLPPHLPAPFLLHQRGTDQYGFAALDTNFYWVPGTRREDVTLLEYADHVKVYRGREFLVEYPLPPEGTRNQRFHPQGHTPPRHAPSNRKRPTAEEETRLRAVHEKVGAWLDFALAPGGVARHRQVRELFRLCQQTTSALFVQSVERALRYGVRSAEAVRRIAQLYVGEAAGMLPSAEVDQGLLERGQYVEGRLTDTPDFSAWDGMLDADETEVADGR
jgi:transposase